MDPRGIRPEPRSGLAVYACVLRREGAGVCDTKRGWVGPMPDLVLGSLLRYADASEATVWAETDAPCQAGVLGCSFPTFRVGRHHYALVHVTGLEPWKAYPYEVR